MCRKGYTDGVCSGWGPGMGAWVATRWLVVRDLRLLRVFAVLRDDGGLAPETSAPGHSRPRPDNRTRNSHHNGVTANTVTPPAGIPNHGTSEYLHFISQQVGERDMACVKAALGQPPSPSPIGRQAIAASGLRPLAFLEHDAEYVVRDIESQVFWLNALNPAHADVDGQSALADAATLNRSWPGTWTDADS